MNSISAPAAEIMIGAMLTSLSSILIVTMLLKEYFSDAGKTITLIFNSADVNLSDGVVVTLMNPSPTAKGVIMPLSVTLTISGFCDV